jgi:hypothetical protein
MAVHEMKRKQTQWQAEDEMRITLEKGNIEEEGLG